VCFEEWHLLSSVVWPGVTIASFVAAWLIAGVIRRHAITLSLVQSPNHRSSHVVPTPSGGGIGIAVAGTLTGALAAWQAGPGLWAVVAGGAVIAVLGFVDDIRDLSSRLRFGIQALLVTLLVCTAGAWPDLSSFAGVIPGVVVVPVLLFAGIWWVNLFNFMDGIDGLAASEGIFILAGALALWMAVVPEASTDPVWLWSFCVLAACAGFLLHNWPPARIFMGDAGSNFIALVIFGIALYTVAHGHLNYVSWLILAAVFVADATVTLCRRMLEGQSWLSAHRSHAYQRLSRRWNSHRRVTMSVMAISLAWLLPLAWLSLALPTMAGWILLVAYMPILVGVFLAGGGKVGD